MLLVKLLKNFWLVLLLFGLCDRSAGINYDPGCVVKSTVDIPWQWTSTSISMWAGTSEQQDALLDIEINVKGGSYPRKYDKIALNATTLHFKRTSSLTDHEDSYNDIEVGPGWVDLDFSINENYTLTLGNETLMTNISKTQVTSLTCRGSNVTVNCINNPMIWQVESGRSQYIPLESTNGVDFSIFSKASSIPKIRLGTRDISLAWNKQKKQPSQFGEHPLPAFREHLFMISCDEADIVCDLSFKIHNESLSYKLESFKLKELPKVLIVKGRSQDNFAFLLQPQPQMRPYSKAVHDSDASTGTTTTIGTNTSIVVLSILFVVALLGLIAAVVYIKRAKPSNQSYKIDLEQSLNETASLIDPSISNTHSQMPLTPKKSIRLGSPCPEHPTLWNAILSLDEAAVKQYVSSMQDKQALNGSYVHKEAHFRGNKNIVEAMEDAMGIKQDVPQALMIKEVMEDLDRCLTSVFTAAKAGSYHGREGVDVLLRSYGLPGTVRDLKGQSILHHAVASQDGRKDLKWSINDIRSLLEEHGLYPNAVDYKGRTALHALAEVATVSERWKDHACILVELGCDPRIPDSTGQLPETIAKKNGCTLLHSYLKEENEKKGSIDRKSARRQWSNLLKASKNNDVEKLRTLLQDHTPILPLNATADPLTDAIRNSHIKSTLLLISAGAPLCGRALLGLTALEAAHGTHGQPALLPALLRREYFNALIHESSLIESKDEKYNSLKSNLKSFAEIIKKQGNKATWKFKEETNRAEISKEARSVLCLAAENDMSLTCQILGLEDVFLQPLPREDRPESKAKMNALLVLCRDLKLSLLFILDDLPANLVEYEEIGCEKLQGFCSHSHPYIDIGKGNERELKFIAEQGNVPALHKYYKNNLGIVNKIVDIYTGYTMLHYAAYNGRLDMVDYLLYSGADAKIKSKHGFSPSHVAASRGHKECMEYILAFIESKENHRNNNSDTSSVKEDMTKSGLTAEQIINGYEKEVDTFRMLLVPNAESIPKVLNATTYAEKSELLLQTKMSKLKLENKDKWREHILSLNTLPCHKDVWSQLKEESDNFLQILWQNDERFRGEIFTLTTEQNTTEILLMDSFQLYIEINTNEKWEGTKFKKEFLSVCERTLENYSFITKNLCLIPRGLSPTSIGVNLYVAYCSEEITFPVSIHLVPSLKKEYPADKVKDNWPEKWKYILKDSLCAHLCNTKEGNWNYITTNVENQLLDNINEEQKLVLQTCRLLRQFFNPCWWFPRVESRRHGRTWHAYAVTIKSTSERLIRTCLLKEIAETTNNDWAPNLHLNRVVSIYQRMLENGIKDEKTTEVINVKSFLDPDHSDIKVYLNSVNVIIDCLKKLL